MTIWGWSGAEPGVVTIFMCSTPFLRASLLERTNLLGRMKPTPLSNQARKIRESSVCPWIPSKICASTAIQQMKASLSEKGQESGQDKLTGPPARGFATGRFEKEMA